MALLSKHNGYARVEDIRVGKNIMEFSIRVYADMTLTPIQEKTVTAPYNIDGPNPFIQAYEWIKSNEELSGQWSSDNIETKKKKVKNG